MYALTTHQLQVERRESHRANPSVCDFHTPATGGEGERDIEPIQVYALTTHQATGGRGERVIESIFKCMLSPHNQLQVRGRRVIEPHSSVCAHTHQLQVEEERES